MLYIRYFTTRQMGMNSDDAPFCGINSDDAPFRGETINWKKMIVWLNGNKYTYNTVFFDGRKRTLQACGCWDDRDEKKLLLTKRKKKSTRKSIDFIKKERLRRAAKGTKSILNFTCQR